MGEGVGVDDQGELRGEVVLRSDHTPQPLHQFPVVFLGWALTPQVCQQIHQLSLGLNQDGEHLFCITVTETWTVSTHLL